MVRPRVWAREGMVVCDLFSNIASLCAMSRLLFLFRLSTVDCQLSSIALFAQNSQHATQRLRRTPKQLIADCERAKISRAHCQRVQTPNGYGERARNCGRRQATQCRIFIV